MYKGKSLYVINESSSIESFQQLLNDLDTITYASYFCEIIDISMQDEEINRELFRLLVTAFYLIKNNAVDIEILARAFEIKLLQATGYGFNLENCCICRKKINSSNYISFQYSGGVCSECSKVNGFNISYAAYNAVKYLCKIPLENVYRINLAKETKQEIYKTLSQFINQSYFRRPKSLDVLSSLTKFNQGEI